MRGEYTVKQFEIPEINIIRFETEDILTDSAREDELKIIPIE